MVSNVKRMKRRPQETPPRETKGYTTQIDNFLTLLT
jgi:hypothetical protein